MNDETSTKTYRPAIEGPFASEKKALASKRTWSPIKTWQDDTGQWWAEHLGPTFMTTPPPLMTPVTGVRADEKES